MQPLPTTSPLPAPTIPTTTNPPVAGADRDATQPGNAWPVVTPYAGFQGTVQVPDGYLMLMRGQQETEFFKTARLTDLAVGAAAVGGTTTDLRAAIANARRSSLGDAPGLAIVKTIAGYETRELITGSTPESDFPSPDGAPPEAHPGTTWKPTTDVSMFSHGRIGGTNGFAVGGARELFVAFVDDGTALEPTWLGDRFGGWRELAHAPIQP